VTIQNTIGILQRAAELGLKLGIEEPDTLTYEPIENCPDDFRETLRTSKPQLLALLRLPFVMVFSQILEETIFFCEDDYTRAALMEAGASEWSIYTRDELRILCEQNRVAPLSDDELRKVHEIKRTFKGSLRDL
jgi:hypothetical protein